MPAAIESTGIDPEQRTGDPRVAYVELGSLDQPAQPDRMPRRQAFEQRDVIVDRLASNDTYR